MSSDPYRTPAQIEAETIRSKWWEAARLVVSVVVVSATTSFVLDACVSRVFAARPLPRQPPCVVKEQEEQQAWILDCVEKHKGRTKRVEDCRREADELFCEEHETR